jgi:5-methyltetrahydrofolate--homocysteine methyltransferase
MKTTLEQLSDAVKDGDNELAVKLVNVALADNTSAVDILNEGLVPGVKALSELFKDGQAYLPEVLISVRAMKQGLEVIQSQLGNMDLAGKGKIVLGTVEGDIHDIGKNLVGMMLGSNGYEVIDIGVDVTADTFVAAVTENEPDILAMSALLTTTMEYIPEVINALEKAGLREKTKVLIGGACITREFADEVGVEGFAMDCVSAVDEANRITGH